MSESESGYKERGLIVGHGGNERHEISLKRRAGDDEVQEGDKI
jgi:hypothetical protein